MERAPASSLTIRMSGQLLVGVSRIYSRKVEHLYSDCTETASHIREFDRVMDKNEQEMAKNGAKRRKKAANGANGDLFDLNGSDLAFGDPTLLVLPVDELGTEGTQS